MSKAVFEIGSATYTQVNSKDGYGIYSQTFGSLISLAGFRTGIWTVNITARTVTTGNATFCLLPTDPPSGNYFYATANAGTDGTELEYIVGSENALPYAQGSLANLNSVLYQPVLIFGGPSGSATLTFSATLVVSD